VVKSDFLAAVVALAMLCCAGLVHAQTSTPPGPTNPTPQPNPMAKPGSDIVLNPTVEECQQGWHAGLKWTKEQFEGFCGQMKISK
jgi:hypothetical protein